MTLVPQTDNKLQRHLVSKFRTKKKSAAIQLKFGMVAGIWLLYMPTKFQPNWQQKNSSKKILCLLWLLKPQMNVPLIYVLFLFMERDAMLWLFSFPVFHISHVIKDNVLLPSYILRHNVNILQRVLAKYLSWHPLF